MMRPAWIAAEAGSKPASPCAITSAFTNVLTWNAPTSSRGATVLFPAPFGPATMTACGCVGSLTVDRGAGSRKRRGIVHVLLRRAQRGGPEPATHPPPHDTGRRSDGASEAGDGADVRGDLGVDVSRVAARVLPRGAGAPPRTGVRQPPDGLDRDQRLVLLPPAPNQLREVVRRNPARLRVRGEGSRFITHMLKLRNVETALPNFFASGVLRLREKLGPILWQFPERFPADLDRFAGFLDALPKTSAQAAEIAARHDQRLDGRAWTEAEVDIPLRHAFEIRHPGFLGPDFVALLREHGAALVFADTAGRWPYAEDVTADFVYVRLHGAEQLYASGYTDEQLDWWAARIREWRRGCQPSDATCVAPLAKDATAGRDVFVYFDNDAKVHAPFDAIGLKERLEG